MSISVVFVGVAALTAGNASHPRGYRRSTPPDNEVQPICSPRSSQRHDPQPCRIVDPRFWSLTCYLAQLAPAVLNITEEDILAAPMRIDWHKLGALTPVKNQGVRQIMRMDHGETLL